MKTEKYVEFICFICLLCNTLTYFSYLSIFTIFSWISFKMFSPFMEWFRWKSWIRFGNCFILQLCKECVCEVSCLKCRNLKNEVGFSFSIKIGKFTGNNLSQVWYLKKRYSTVKLYMWVIWKFSKKLKPPFLCLFWIVLWQVSLF